MRHSCHDRIVRRTLVVLGLAGLVSALCHGADYPVHVVEPAVTNHMVLRDGPLPPVCREATAMEVFACRGEYEPASFVITTSEPLKDVRVEVAPVTGPGGCWPPEAVDVRVVKEYYRWTLAQGPGDVAAAVPTLLVHDENFLAIEPIPNDPYDWKRNVARGPIRDTAELRPVQIDRRQQFWVTVHVPERATPGTYRTTVRIIPQNSDPSELSLQVEVCPFDLLPLPDAIGIGIAIITPGWTNIGTGTIFGDRSPGRREVRSWGNSTSCSHTMIGLPRTIRKGCNEDEKERRAFGPDFTGCGYSSGIDVRRCLA